MENLSVKHNLDLKTLFRYVFHAHKHIFIYSIYNHTFMSVNVHTNIYMYMFV